MTTVACQGEPTYHRYDGLGSTADLTDGSGNSVASYGYDVFGALRSQSGSSDNYWLFTGEQEDADSEMYYLRARYYDPAIGRLVTQDPRPLGSLYAYVHSNPVNFADPNGMCPFCPVIPIVVCFAIDECRDSVTDPVVDTLKTAAESIAEAFGPPYTSTKILQILDLLPIREVCGTPTALAVAGGASAGTGAIMVAALCSSGATFLGVAAFTSTEIDIFASECGPGRKVGASLVNAGNLLLDLGWIPVPDPSRFGLANSAAELALYIGSSELVHCKE